MFKSLNIWFISSLLVSIVVLIPIITVFSSFFEDTSNYYQILKDTFLFEYIFNSLTLLICVLALTFIFGISAAYLVSFYTFPLSNFFKWAMILSFAVPPYIYAYSLTAFFENYGTLYSILKNLLGEGNYNQYIPKFDGLLGAVLSLSFSLFAYVYILSRASFLYQSQNLIDLGRSLGFSKYKSFYSLILPAARPAIVTGLSLVAMETLAEFGAVDFFSINTLTTGIYNSWITFDDLNTANQISFVLLIFIFLLFSVEIYSRKEARYHQPGRGFKPINKIKLHGSKSLVPFSFCLVIFLVSFIFPVFQMIYWTLKFPKYFQDLNFWNIGFNTLLLVFISCILMIIFAFIVNYGNRVSKSKFLEVLTAFSVSGYAIPGVILAVAFITLVSYLDSLIFMNFKTVFIGSVFGLVIVYFIRFFALSANGIKSGYLKINQSMDESAYLLGYSKFKTFTKVHIPYLKNSVLLVSILIAIEIIKELPITLILRPFNFETFATTAYIYASQDLLEAAAAPSLFLVLIASMFILFVSKYILSDK